jgi:hypothetical protein
MLKSWALLTVATTIMCGGNSLARGAALDPEVYTDGFNPATELYQINEVQRRDQIARQVDLNRRMIWSSGYVPGLPTIFEPWPRVPGDIWGYPQNRPVEQPLGHESRQVGPNRWIYRPVYGTSPALPAGVRRDMTAPIDKQGAVKSEIRNIEPPRPSDAGPDDFVPPGASAVGGAAPKRQTVGKRQF